MNSIRNDFGRQKRRVSSLNPGEHNQFGKRLLFATTMFLLSLPAVGQYPGQIQQKDKAKNAPIMRSVVVVEWTGDLKKPKASRVIPISVWDGSELQDGGIYLARPNPLALDGGVEYELQQNGDRTGYFVIDEAARQQSAWIGFGKWKPIPSGPTPEELAKQRAALKIKIDEDDDGDKPILHRKQHADEAGGGGDAGSAQKAPPDSDRPTLKRGGDADGDSGKDSNESAKAGPAPDPDRPRLSAPKTSDDPDRPKLQNKLPADADMGPVSSVPSSGDPDRPTLKRGAPQGASATVAPTLMGLPPEMKQEVGVSDARTIKAHSWEFSWANPDDQRKMKEALEDEARKALGLNPPPAPAVPPKRPASTAAARRKANPAPEPPAPAPLIDEQFRVFELSYGGGATMVFSAHSDGSGEGENGVQKFVTIVAQPDLYGSVITILKNVTDTAHLDVRPRMKLVDAVDAEGDNRGELLFELRGQNQRQFALYRVLRGQASQIFETGASYFGAAGE